MKTTTLLAALALGLGASVASADVLWNQPIDTGPEGVSFFDAIAPGFNGAIVYAVSDVSVPASGWQVNSVTTYFSNIGFPATVTSAVLNIFPKTGALPSDTVDPRASPLGMGSLVVPVDVRYEVDFQPVMELSATGLNIDLPAGEYWIGLTPVLSAGPFGIELHWGTAATIGDATASRDYTFGALPWGATAPGRDAAIRVDGVVPAPGALGLLAMGGLLAARRRR